MNTSSKIREVKLLVVALLCAALLIFGHLILAKSFADQLWTEYTAASIPFILLAICGLAIRFAVNNTESDPNG